MSKPSELLEQARQLAASAPSWADLSNALFDPTEGIVARAFATRDEREVFVKTPEYREIRMLLDKARERFGLVAGATPKRSGHFVVSLPRSLQAALEKEADTEGVSLNQLIVTKLAVQLHVLTEAR